MEPLRVGVIGCGNISGVYFRNLSRCDLTTVVACADLDRDRAEAAAREHGVPMVLSSDDLTAHADVDIVVNLTVPKAHAPLSLQAVRSGKHVYSEKPLAADFASGAALMDAAHKSGRLVGCAPDTFLGGSHQTCRDLIDSGVIGEPVGAAAFMLCHGHESWHPSPEFYYEVGGGPMMDMGPYYLTALVNLLGPIRTVTGSTRITFPERTITSQPKYGKVVKVETPTHITGVMEFQSGAIGVIVTSFDVWHSTLPRIEVWGTEGTLLVPDPNGFGGTPLIRRAGQNQWEEVEVTRPFTSNARGIGVADMAAAIVSGTAHRASGELALHVLDAMQGFNLAASEHRHYGLKAAGVRPEALPIDRIVEADGRWLFSERT